MQAAFDSCGEEASSASAPLPMFSVVCLDKVDGWVAEASSRGRGGWGGSGHKRQEEALGRQPGNSVGRRKRQGKVLSWNTKVGALLKAASADGQESPAPAL